MPEKQYGGRIQVFMQPILQHIADKIGKDTSNLKQMFDTGEGSHDFEGQTNYLQHIQAGVRAIDVLTGKVDHVGDTIPRVQAKIATAPARVDMTQIEKELGTPNQSQLQAGHGEIAA